MVHNISIYQNSQPAYRLPNHPPYPPHSSFSKFMGFSTIITIRRPLNGCNLALQIFIRGKPSTCLQRTSYTRTKFWYWPPPYLGEKLVRRCYWHWTLECKHGFLIFDIEVEEWVKNWITRPQTCLKICSTTEILAIFGKLLAEFKWSVI